MYGTFDMLLGDGGEGELYATTEVYNMREMQAENIPAHIVSG